MAEAPEQTIALHHYLAVVRRRKWLIVGAALLVPLVTAVFAALQSPVYEGSAKVLLQRQNLASRLTGIPEATASVETETLVNTQAEVARVPAIARAVVAQLGPGDMSVGRFLDISSVSASPESEILTFRVRDGDRRLAAQAATAYAQQYSRYRREQDTASIISAREGVKRHVRELEESGGASGRLYDSLLNREQQLQTMATLQTSNTTVIEAARSAEQVAPRPVRNGVIGFVVGLVMGLGLAFLIEALDTRIRTARELEAQLGIPLLARVPPAADGDDDEPLAMMSDPEGGQAEAFRMLRTNVEFTLLDRDASSIMVTSALEEEGKSTTVANLALALAQAGKRVGLIDLDLRRPRLDRFFGLERGPGVVEVVLGKVDLNTAVKRAPIEPEQTSGGVAQGADNGAGGRLEVLTSGSLPPNPGEFVASRRLPEMLKEFSERVDLLLVDSPPLLHVGDAMTLSADIDALVIVARQNRLRQGNVHETARLLTAMRAHKLGFVLTGVAEGDGYGYGYGYRRHPVYAEREGQFVT